MPDFDPEKLESEIGFWIGTGIADVTDHTPGLGIQGFADDLQKTTDVETHLYSRAFIIAKNKDNPDNSDRTVLVNADIWSCTQAVKTEVINRLGAHPGLKDLYTAENVLISGTHTHSGPGGFSHYFLYHLTMHGFDEINFNKIVDGIVASIVKAHANLAPGRIYLNKGDVNDCGMNRSILAYEANHDHLQYDPVDKEMLLLKFVKDDDGHGKPYDIGALCWYGIHPTSRGQWNTLVSGDNKGWASHLFESEINKNYTASEPFVAAFANSCGGDVSGSLDKDGVIIPHDRVNDVVLMKKYGELQYSVARELFLKATKEVTGDIFFRYTHIQINDITIEEDSTKRTWPGAMGISSGAGSTEDGKATLFIDKLGINIHSPIKEGVTTADLAFDNIRLLTEAEPLLQIPGAKLMVHKVINAATKGIGVENAAAAVIRIIPKAERLGLLDKLLNWIPVRILSAIGLVGLRQVLKDHPLEVPDPAWDLPGLDPRNRHRGNPNNSNFIAGHAPKLIMLPVGNSKPFPLVPGKLPIQLIKIGEIVIAGIPAEITAMASRRFKATLQKVFSSPIQIPEIPPVTLIAATYANAYSGYITTEEEYSKQHYEGASTLYGPHTLAAYQQEFSKLAVAIVTGVPVSPGSPEEVHFVKLRERGIPKDKIYVNNRTGKDVGIKVSGKSGKRHSKVPANENLLIKAPRKNPFFVRINSDSPIAHNGGDIITIQ